MTPGRGLAVVAFAALAAAVTASGSGGTPLRVVLAIPLALFLPGLALGGVLFRRRSMAAPERALVAVALSLATLVIGGLLLYLSPWRLDATSWALFLLAATAGATGLAVARRPAAVREQPVPRRGPAARHVVGLVVVLALVGASVALARMPLSAHGVRGYTELSLLGPSGSTRALVLRVRSGELANRSYRLVLRLSGRDVLAWRLGLAPGDTWVRTISVPATAKGEVGAVLYRDSAQTPYRSVRVDLAR